MALVTVPYETDQAGPLRVTCSVGKGEPAVLFGDSARPAEPPEVRVLAVEEDRAGGAVRPDLVEVIEGELERGSLCASALEAAASEQPDYPRRRRAGGQLHPEDR